MKKLERSEMKNLKGGLEDPPDQGCLWTCTGTGGPGQCDYHISCTSGYQTDACSVNCAPSCNNPGEWCWMQW